VSQILGKIRDRLHDLARRLAPLGPTLARLTVGLVFLKSGWGKLHSLPDVTDYFTSLHIPMPGFNARLAASTEFFGGLLLVVGLGTRLVVLPMAFTMVIAIITAKLPDVHDVWDFAGLEEWSYLVFFIWFALAGAGPLSLDRLIAPRLDRFFGNGAQKKNKPPETVTA
jgi:putative oxidoreductase